MLKRNSLFYQVVLSGRWGSEPLHALRFSSEVHITPGKEPDAFTKNGTTFRYGLRTHY